MPDHWYYTRKSERLGPVSFAKLKSLVESGWLAPHDLVWQAGMPNWISAKDADGLFVNPFVLHFFCVLGALSGNPWTESKTTVVRQ